MGAPDDPGQALCPECGLCCSGAIYGVVPVTADEEESVEELGMAVLAFGEDRRGFGLPCAALAGTRCTIYPDRFTTCRNFRCQLLLDMDDGKETLETARARIAEAKRLLAELREAAGPDEGIVKARLRALRGEGDPAFNLAGMAMEYFLDRHFRKPHQRQFDRPDGD